MWWIQKNGILSLLFFSSSSILLVITIVKGKLGVTKLTNYNASFYINQAVSIVQLVTKEWHTNQGNSSFNGLKFFVCFFAKQFLDGFCWQLLNQTLAEKCFVSVSAIFISGKISPTNKHLFTSLLKFVTLLFISPFQSKVKTARFKLVNLVTNANHLLTSITLFCPQCEIKTFNFLCAKY